MTGVSWRPGCPVPLRDLRVVTASYRGFDGRAHTGRIVVHRDVARDVLAVLRRLYAAGFPIRRMVPVDAYGGSDFRSIEADNTSAFNCRYVDGTTRWSEHAYGRAIDLNPIENPYVTAAGTTSHAASRPYLRRSPVPAGDGRRGRDGRAGLRGGRLVVGRPLVGRQGLPALLGERSVTGALALVAGCVLLAVGSLRLAAMLRPRSTASFLLGAYVAAWTQLVGVLWALSLFGWVTRWGLLAGLALVCAALVVDTRGWSDVGDRLREANCGAAGRTLLGADLRGAGRRRARGLRATRSCSGSRRRRTTSTRSSTTSGARASGCRTRRSAIRTAPVRRTSTPTRRTARWASSRRWCSAVPTGTWRSSRRRRTSRWRSG